MAMPQSTLRLFRTAITCGVLLVPQGCFVYTEELLDSDVVSLGGGAVSGMPTQSKLKVLPKPPLVSPVASHDAVDAADAGVTDAASDAPADVP